MPDFLAAIIRWTARLAAGLVIVLALLVGVARLLLPEAASFAADIRSLARDVSGFDVDFDLISAGVSLHGPELRFYGVSVRWPDGQRVIAVVEASVALDVLTLLTKGKLRPGRLYVSGANIDVRVLPDETIQLQGRPWQDYFGPDRQMSQAWPNLQLKLREIGFNYADSSRDLELLVETLDAELRPDRLSLTAALLPEPGFGRRFELAADIPRALIQAPRELADDIRWSVQLRAEDVRLAPWLLLTGVTSAAVLDSEGAAELDLNFNGLRPTQILAAVDLKNLILAPPGGGAVLYDRVAGDFNWQHTATGWLAQAEKLRIERRGRAWPESSGSIRYEKLVDAGHLVIGVADFLRLEDLTPILQTFAGDLLNQAGLTGTAAGEVWDTSARILLQADEVTDYAVQSDFAGLGYATVSPDIEFSGISGRLAADTSGGTLELASRNAAFRVADWFGETIIINRLDGLAVWRAGPDGYRVIMNNVSVETPDGQAEASLELFTDRSFGAPELDMLATASLPDIRTASRYLPVSLSLPVRDWLGKALAGGQVTGAGVQLRGPLDSFPFRNDEGIFHIEVEFTDVLLDYAPGWPRIEDASGKVVFDKAGLFSVENRLSIQGIELENVTAKIADLNEGQVSIDADAAVDLSQLKKFLQATPVGDRLGSAFANVGARGAATAQIQLGLPVRRLADWELDGQLTTADGSIWLAGLAPRLDRLRGTATIRNTAVTLEPATARVLGESVVVAVVPAAAADTDYSHRATLAGSFAIRSLLTALEISPPDLIDGRTEVELAAFLPVAGPEDTGVFRLQVDSPLTGLTSLWPYPLNKTVDEAERLRLIVRFPDTDQLQLSATLDRGMSVALEFLRDSDRWLLSRGSLLGGSEAAVLPATEGLELRGYLDRVSLSEWLAVVPAAARAAGNGQSGWQTQFRRADFQLGRLDALGYSFNDLDLQLEGTSGAWNINVGGPLLEGRLRVPFASAGADPLEFDLSRLYLLDTDSEATAASDERSVDPRNFPDLLGQIEDFSLGTMRLGQLDVDIRKTPGGLRVARLETAAPNFELSVFGDWLVVDNAQRSRLRAELNSGDFAATLERLGYTPLIDASSAVITADLLWEGGPGMAAVLASTGQLEILLRNGRVRDVEAGGGRLLGLLSVASLPRRLALDFSDITDNSLAFDKISGRFRMDFGNAFTCNLALEGEVADLVIVGRTGLGPQDYDQIAAVRPHVSNLMPVSAAFLGGPTVGIAALLVTQLFRKPLSSIGESYYKISGSWSAPEFVAAQRSELDTSAYADCESQLPNLSPEELAAFEGLASDAVRTGTTAPPESTETMPAP